MGDKRTGQGPVFLCQLLLPKWTVFSLLIEGGGKRKSIPSVSQCFVTGEGEWPETFSYNFV